MSRWFGFFSVVIDLERVGWYKVDDIPIAVGGVALDPPDFSSIVELQTFHNEALFGA